LIISKA